MDGFTGKSFGVSLKLFSNYSSVQVVSVNGENVRVSYNSKIIDVKMADIVKLTAPDQPLEVPLPNVFRDSQFLL